MSLEINAETEGYIRDRAAAEGVSVNELLTRAFTPKQMQSSQSSDPVAHVQALLTRWQTEENTPFVPPVPTLPGESATQALFRRWREDEAHRTNTEIEDEDKLWADVEQSLLDNNRLLRMRTLP